MNNKYYNNQPKKDKKQIYLTTCEKLITDKLPELTGKFTVLDIWNSLIYFFYQNISTMDASQKIINEYSKKQ